MRKEYDFSKSTKNPYARNVLVIGGTRFFGKKLVQKLIKNGDRVTAASRNLAGGNFGPEVQAVTIEREDAHSIEQALKDKKSDLVYEVNSAVTRIHFVVAYGIFTFTCLI